MLGIETGALSRLVLLPREYMGRKCCVAMESNEQTSYYCYSRVHPGLYITA